MNIQHLYDKEILLRGKYIILTKHYKKAILLEYFSMRQEEENDWFNASYPKISQETLLNLSIPPIKNYIEDLIINKWLSRRRNPQKKYFGASYQYKVDFKRIENDLSKIIKNDKHYGK